MRNPRYDAIPFVGLGLLMRILFVDSFTLPSDVGLRHLHCLYQPSLALHGSKQPDFEEEYDDYDDDSHKDWENSCFPIHVIASPQVLLPGEHLTLSLMDKDTIPLIQDIVLQEMEEEDHHSSSWGGAALLAMAVQLEDSTVHYEEDWTMAQVASLCEIVGLATTDATHAQLDLNCIGRVRLERMIRSYSSNHFQFTGEHISESLNHMNGSYEKAKRLEKNINQLIKQISNRQEELETVSSAGIENGDSKSTTISPIKESYLEKRAKIMRLILGDPALQDGLDNANQSRDSHQSEILRLTATSRAVFLSLHDDKLEARYRLRALDWDNLLERLKLGQYALREKQLLMQGLFLQTQSTSSDHSTRKDFDDAFQ